MRLLRFKKNSDKDDNTLIENYRLHDDKEAIGILFERYAPLVLGVCMKYLKQEDDSKDAVLQIFEKLMSDLKKYEIARFSGWLHSVAKNYCLMQLRNKSAMYQQTQSMTEEVIFMESEAFYHPEEGNVSEVYLAHMSEAIQSLNNEQKTCIELFYLKEESYQEIADLTGFSLNQVKSYIQNGKRNLKLFLQKLNHEDAK